MGKLEVERFLTHLATEPKVATFTQNQALSAPLFLYKQVPEVEIDWIDDVAQDKQPAHGTFREHKAGTEPPETPRPSRDRA